MPEKKREHPKEKTRLHARNKHRERYDFKQLIASTPELASYVALNIHGDESVDFFNPDAVKTLNKALLKHHYGINYWDIPPGYLCPPIPGRADYIHHMADLLANSNGGEIPSGKQIKCLDIGVGANCVYPIIGNKEYGWSFTGTDIDPVAIDSAKRIVEQNPALKNNVELRLQHNRHAILLEVIKKEEQYDLAICNPPFHASLEDAQSGTLRKLSNLTQKKVVTPTLNFGGQNTELWCEGGEVRFIEDYISESKKYATSCFWFSSLVAKQSHLNPIYDALEDAGVFDVQTAPMGQGNKTMRIVAWTFLDPRQREEWAKTRW